MSKELIALIYNFLVQNDGTCAEIFKRGFNPDPTSVDNLPPLEEIVEQFKNSSKRNLKKATKSLSEDGAADSKKIMEIAQQNPSHFLEHIVKKRIEKTEKESSTETDSSEDVPTPPSSSSSSEETVMSAKKRRKMNSGSQKKLWSANKKSKK